MHHPLLKLPNVIVTPHIASRTYESVVRQATTAVNNLILAMKGEKPIAREVNPEVPVQKIGLMPKKPCTNPPTGENPPFSQSIDQLV